MIYAGGKYSANVTEIAGYRSSMKLHINPLSQAEFGAYRCVAKNSLGDTDGTIKLYSKYRPYWACIKAETNPKLCRNTTKCGQLCGEL